MQTISVSTEIEVRVLVAPVSFTEQQTILVEATGVLLEAMPSFECPTPSLYVTKQQHQIVPIANVVYARWEFYKQPEIEYVVDTALYRKRGMIAVRWTW